MTIKYTTRGSVRGGCGHKHNTIAAAQRCCERDQRDCASLPGGKSYSDRVIRRVDGAGLSDEEHAEWSALTDGAR